MCNSYRFSATITRCLYRTDHGVYWFVATFTVLLKIIFLNNTVRIKKLLGKCSLAYYFPRFAVSIRIPSFMFSRRLLSRELRTFPIRIIFSCFTIAERMFARFMRGPAQKGSGNRARTPDPRT